MKKALALLVLSLATLPSLAEHQFLQLHTRIGTGKLKDASPNNGLITAEHVDNTKNYGYVESGTFPSNTLTIAEIPVGQQFDGWWFYYATGSESITTNDYWWGANTQQTNIVWTYQDGINPSDNLVHIVADFSYIDYKLHYNGNGGGGNMSQESHVYTNVFNLASNQFTKTGYTFSGWTNETITTALADQSSVSGAVFGVTYTNKTVTLYAQWTANTYAVTLNPNYDAAQETNSVQVTYDAAWPALQVPTRDGYRFGGWYTAASGGSLVDTNATYRTAANTTNYAHWVEQVTATFKDGYTGETLKTETLDKGGTPTAPGAPEHEGYYSTGWMPAVGSISVNTTFTLVYAPYTYTVVFHADNGTGQTASQQFTYNASAASLNPISSLSGFSLTGYDFQNWTNSTGTAFVDGQPVSNLAQSGMYHLYAVWSPIQYTIAFDGNGATGGSVGSVNATYDVEYPIPANGYEKAGLDFEKWRLGLDGGTYDPGDVVSNLTTVAGDTVTFYAVWSEPRYIAFDGNGANEAAAMADDTMTFEGVETKTLVSNKFKKAGYTFAGWATNEVNAATLMTDYVDGAEVVSTNLWMDIGETIVFYAVWQTNTYTVVFNPNCTSYTGEMEPQSFVYDQAQALTVNGFTNETGLAFAGWTNYTDKVGYADGVTVSNLTDAANGTVTLHALWNVGELSKAMDCDNLYWDIPPGATNGVAKAVWNVSATGGVNDDACAVSGGSALSYMAVTVKTNGTLRFKWKATEDVATDYFQIVKYMATSPSITYNSIVSLTGVVGSGDWHDSGDIAVPLDLFNENGTLTFGIRFRTSASNPATCYIDQMTWTPEGSTVEPTEEDKPTISAFMATANGFTLSVDPSNISDSFSYQILATNELVVGDWPVKTNLTAEAVKAGFDIVPEAGEPTMFYKVKVIAK